MKVIDFVAARRRRGRKDVWRFEITPGGDLLITVYDATGEVDAQYEWPRPLAERVVDGLHRQMQHLRRQEYRAAHPPPPPPPPPKWKRCGCTPEGYYGFGLVGCSRRFGHDGPHRNRGGEEYHAEARHGVHQATSLEPAPTSGHAPPRR